VSLSGNTCDGAPGGNITGVTIAAELELIGKRIGLLMEAMPKLPSITYLVSRSYWDDLRGAAAREAAKRTGISLKAALLGSAFDEGEYQRAFRVLHAVLHAAFNVQIP